MMCDDSIFTCMKCRTGAPLWCNTEGSIEVHTGHVVWNPFISTMLGTLSTIHRTDQCMRGIDCSMGYRWVLSGAKIHPKGSPKRACHS